MNRSLLCSKFLKTLGYVSVIGTGSVFIAYCSKQSPENTDNKLMKIRPNLDEYERIDTWVEQEKYKILTRDHALYNTLLGDGKLEAYEIYRKKGEDEILGVLKFGSSINGHRGIVHGGVTALVLDNTYGWLFMAMKFPPCVTANLTVDYRSPIYANSYSILRAKVDSFEGRKLYMSASIEDADTGKIQAESKTLFIAMKAPTVQQTVTHIINSFTKN